MGNNELQAKILRLQEENEQLKALCDTYFTCYRAKHNDIEVNLFSYRKALEEIREICKKETSHYDRLIEIVTKVGEVLK